MSQITVFSDASAPPSSTASSPLKDVDPQVWLADVLARIAENPANRLDELLPWDWSNPEIALAA